MGLKDFFGFNKKAEENSTSKTDNSDKSMFLNQDKKIPNEDLLKEEPNYDSKQTEYFEDMLEKKIVQGHANAANSQTNTAVKSAPIEDIYIPNSNLYEAEAVKADMDRFAAQNQSVATQIKQEDVAASEELEKKKMSQNL